MNDIGHQKSSHSMRVTDGRFDVAADTSGEYYQMKYSVNVLKI